MARWFVKLHGHERAGYPPALSGFIYVNPDHVVAVEYSTPLANPTRATSVVSFVNGDRIRVLGDQDDVQRELDQALGVNTYEQNSREGA